MIDAKVIFQKYLLNVQTTLFKDISTESRHERVKDQRTEFKSVPMCQYRFKILLYGKNKFSWRRIRNVSACPCNLMTLKWEEWTFSTEDGSPVMHAKTSLNVLLKEWWFVREARYHLMEKKKTFTLMLLVAILVNRKWCKKSWKTTKKTGKWVLVW